MAGNQMDELLISCLMHQNDGTASNVRARSELFVAAAGVLFPIDVSSAPILRDAEDNIDVEREMRVTQRTTTQLLLILEQYANQIQPSCAIVALQLHISKLNSSCSESYIRIAQRYLMLIDQFDFSKIIAEVADVSTTVTQLACSIGRSKQLVRTLRFVACIVAPHSSCLTSVHADFLQACISCQLYAIGIRFLKEHIFIDIEQERTAITTQDIFRFYYYAGICFMAEKSYNKALECFDMIISAPANALSVIVVNALKKSKLISLVARGEKYAFPKNISAVVLNFSKSTQSPYDEIAKLFVEDDFASLREAILLKREVLDKDNNYGLAKQVIEAWKIRRLKQLSQVFVTLPLDRVTKELLVHDSSSVVTFLHKAMSSEVFSCKINPDSEIIKFVDDNDGATFADAKLVLLNQQLGRVMIETAAFSNKMRELQKVSMTSTSYIMKNTSGGGTSAGGNRASWMGTIASGAMDIEY